MSQPREKNNVRAYEPEPLQLGDIQLLLADEVTEMTIFVDDKSHINFAVTSFFHAVIHLPRRNPVLTVKEGGR